MCVSRERASKLHHWRSSQCLRRRGDALSDPAKILRFATDLAHAAGCLLLDYQERRDSLTTRSKSSPTDLVSAADRDSEALLRHRIEEAFPDDGILGEEQVDRSGSSGRTWIVDPLDGTTNFLFGIPIWAVSIACEDAKGTLAACVLDPSRNELFTAARGQGAQLNGEPMAVSTRDKLAHALVATGFNYKSALRHSQARQLAELITEVRDVRRCGAASIDLAWVACGRLDGFYEAGLSHWDWAAGSLLVREAGGTFARIQSPHGVEQIIAGNATLGTRIEQLASA